MNIKKNAPYSNYSKTSFLFLSPFDCQRPRSLMARSTGVVTGKQALSYLVGGSINWLNTMEGSLATSAKLEIQTSLAQQFHF